MTPIFVDWIDTTDVYLTVDYVLNQNCKFEWTIDYKVGRNTRNIHFLYTYQQKADELWIGMNSGELVIYRGRYTSDKWGSLAAPATNITHYIDLKNKKVSWNNGSVIDGLNLRTPTYPNTNIPVIGAYDRPSNTYGTSTTTIRHARIWDNDVLVMDLSACRYNGEYGLWDSVNEKFYGKSGGAGTITGGYDE